MIERFNIYDVYGYLLPGLTLVGLLWVPYGMTLRVWPAMELGSAVFALVIGYTVGHVLHELTRWFFRSASIKAKDGVRLLPSDHMLEDEDRTFSAEVKTQIKKKIQDWYKIDASNRANRYVAFEMCRNDLLQRGRLSYAEQFQGLYALLRGLAGAALLAAVHLAGWTVGTQIGREWALTCQVGSVVAVGLFLLACVKVEVGEETKKKTSRWPESRFVLLALVLGMIGMTSILFVRSKMGEGLWNPFAELWAPFGVGAIGLAAITVVCLGTYKSFSVSFARTIYRDFLLIDKAAQQRNNEAPV